ncbi:MAG: peptidase S16 [bacterium]|nr:peptidase S16 [bacterium]
MKKIMVTPPQIIAQTDLPERVPVLSRPGLVLLPTSTLPIVVTQSPVLELVFDALKQDRFIGVVQPRDKEDGPLFGSGCLGRISTFSETENGLLIGLTGLCRFSVERELRTTKPYRKAQISYDRFATDLDESLATDTVDRTRLFTALRQYLKTHDIITDWDELQSAPDDRLITAITIAAPFAPQEKQAILELPTLTEQCCLATTLIEMAALDTSDLPPIRH